MARKLLNHLHFTLWLAGFILLVLAQIARLALDRLLQREGLADLSVPSRPRWALARMRQAP